MFLDHVILGFVVSGKDVAADLARVEGGLFTVVWDSVVRYFVDVVADDGFLGYFQIDWFVKGGKVGVSDVDFHVGLLPVLTLAVRTSIHLAFKMLYQHVFLDRKFVWRQKKTE